MSYLSNLIITIPAVLLALMVHEVCHGLAALALGDTTAKIDGRLSLDPFRHLDPIGFICLLFFHVGWAKPVNVNVRNLKKPKRDMALIALAGPLSNFVLAFVMMLLTVLLAMSGTAVAHALGTFCYYTCYISVSLGVFNLIPVPPLDGSKILFSFLPFEWTIKAQRYQQWIQFIMLLLLWFGLWDLPLSVLQNTVIDGMWRIIGGIFA
ncbi:MAG: site-2 protease family protein [Butyricicoccaceae bacterium]